MPTYEYQCEACTRVTTLYQISIARRDDARTCEEKVQRPVLDEQGKDTGSTREEICAGKLARIEIPEGKSIIIDTKGAYESAAILKDGTCIAGTFGPGQAKARGFNQRRKT
jgi:hypothetical protein